jgi:hypothetical protein
MLPLRADLVFSYWIYFWFILYLLKIIKFSPKFALIIGVVDNIGMLIMMLSYGTSFQTIQNFIIINTLIKVIPLYYLKNEKINLKDIYFTSFLFLLFIFWLHLNKQKLNGNLKLIVNSLIYSKNQTPLMSLLTKIENNFKTIQII